MYYDFLKLIYYSKLWCTRGGSHDEFANHEGNENFKNAQRTRQLITTVVADVKITVKFYLVIGMAVFVSCL